MLLKALVWHESSIHEIPGPANRKKEILFNGRNRICRQ